MQRWAPLQGATAQAIERILATQFVDDPAVLHEINDSRTRIAEHLAIARAYQPRTAPVQAIHARYLAAWDDLLSGYRAIEDGLAASDASKLAEGRAAFARWHAALVEVAARLRELHDARK